MLTDNCPQSSEIILFSFSNILTRALRNFWILVGAINGVKIKLLKCCYNVVALKQCRCSTLLNPLCLLSWLCTSAVLINALSANPTNGQTHSNILPAGSRKVLTQIRCFNGNIAVLVPHFLWIPASCDEVFY